MRKGIASLLLIFKARRIGVGLAILGLWLVLAPLFAQTNGPSKLTVRVTDARKAKGAIRVFLFRDAEGFPENPWKVYRFQQVAIDPQTLSAQAAFDDLPQGTYAVAVFHDENMDGMLDRNFIGAPKEGYGASNNPKKSMVLPTFEEAKFSVDDEEHIIAIKLLY